MAAGRLTGPFQPPRVHFESVLECAPPGMLRWASCFLVDPMSFPQPHGCAGVDPDTLTGLMQASLASLGGKGAYLDHCLSSPFVWAQVFSTCGLETTVQPVDVTRPWWRPSRIPTRSRAWLALTLQGRVWGGAERGWMAETAWLGDLRKTLSEGQRHPLTGVVSFYSPRHPFCQKVVFWGYTLFFLWKGWRAKFLPLFHQWSCKAGLRREGVFVVEIPMRRENRMRARMKSLWRHCDSRVLAKAKGTTWSVGMAREAAQNSEKQTPLPDTVVAWTQDLQDRIRIVLDCQQLEKTLPEAGCAAGKNRL